MGTPMTVADLIAKLQEFPQDCVVIYEKYSEYCLLKPEQVEIVRACKPRADGWVQDERPDMPAQTYVCFPRN